MGSCLDDLTVIEDENLVSARHGRHPVGHYDRRTIDHELVELVCAIPPHLKLKGFQRKYLLKRIAASKLPSSVLRKKKWGFLPPISQWFKGDLANYCEHLLLDGASATRTLFDQAEIKAMLENHRQGSQDFGQHLWHLLVFETWYRTHVAGESTN